MCWRAIGLARSGSRQSGRKIRRRICRNLEERVLRTKRTNVTSGQEKPLASLTVPVPQTDTGRRAENAKARERTLAKELGNLAP